MNKLIIYRSQWVKENYYGKTKKDGSRKENTGNSSSG